MKLRLLKLFLFVLILLGFGYLIKILFLDIPKLEGSPLSTQRIKSQIYNIDNNSDTVLFANSGAMIFIFKNSFFDCDSNQIVDDINIVFKEVNSRLDYVLSGLTTTTDGAILETDGMIFIEASSNGNKLCLNNTSSIGIVYPTDSIRPGMQLYSGERDANVGINWEEPIDILNNPAGEVIIVKNVWNQDEVTFDEAVELGIIDTLAVDRLRNESDFWKRIVPVQDGQNFFIEDLNQKYIFEIFDLGWANIDRLLNDERTKEVALLTEVINHSDFGKVFITLVFKNQDIFLPGYQKRDKTFGFTHGDYEKTKLPIGEKAIVIASAYKKGVPYFDKENIVISDSMTITLDLKKTTHEELKKMISQGL